MPSNSPYSALRGLFVLFCLIVLIGGIARFAKARAPSPPPIHIVTSVVPTKSTPLSTPHPSTSVGAKSMVPPNTAPPPPAKPLYKITPTAPTSGASTDYTFSLEECHRSGEELQCTGKTTNRTDAQTRIAVYGARSVDDEGNSSVGNLKFSNGLTSIYLLPDVPINFTIRIFDNHQNAKAVNVQFGANFETNPLQTNSLFFKAIEVQ